MPLLIVPGHDTHPTKESIKKMFDPESMNWSFNENEPNEVYFEIKRTWNDGTWIWRSRHSWEYCDWRVLFSRKAVEAILIEPGDNFSGYEYSLQLITLWADTHSLNYPTEKRFSGIPLSEHGNKLLVQKDDIYTRAMFALIETLGNLPVVAVLQWRLLDVSKYDTFLWTSSLSKRWRKKGARLNKNYLRTHYPCWILEYPERRIWPVFHHTDTWDVLLSISKHPDNWHLNYNAFKEDPRLWELTDDMSVEEIVERFKSILMPILEKQTKTVIRI